jgi:hypothetical protein
MRATILVAGCLFVVSTAFAASGVSKENGSVGLADYSAAGLPQYTDSATPEARMAQGGMEFTSVALADYSADGLPQ